MDQFDIKKLYGVLKRIENKIDKLNKDVMLENEAMNHDREKEEYIPIKNKGVWYEGIGYVCDVCRVKPCHCEYNEK